MRIALATDFYHPHPGGITEHVHNLALQLRLMGHTPVVITSRMGGAGPDDPMVRRVGRSVVLYRNGSFARITVGLDLERRIRDILRAERIDVLHVHGGLTLTFGIVAPAAAHRLGIPVVSTFHSWFPHSMTYRLLQAPLQRRLDRMAAAVTVSAAVVQALSRYFHAPWEIIPNGVNVEQFHPNGRRPGDALKHGPRLLFLGRLDPRNGLDTVLAAMPRILSRHPRARLIVAGDGPLSPYYRRLAHPVGPAVTFLGSVNGARPELYGGADIYLCPTRRASFGVTLLEAMACGTPMVVSDIGGFRELMADREASVLVPVDDPGAWADAVTDLLDDPARRVAMGQAGLGHAAQFSWPRVAARIAGVYGQVLQ